jgi:hypothetical protein
MKSHQQQGRPMIFAVLVVSGRKGSHQLPFVRQAQGGAVDHKHRPRHVRHLFPHQLLQVVQICGRTRGWLPGWASSAALGNSRPCGWRCGPRGRACSYAAAPASAPLGAPESVPPQSAYPCHATVGRSSTRRPPPSGRFLAEISDCVFGKAGRWRRGRPPFVESARTKRDRSNRERSYINHNPCIMSYIWPLQN